MDLHRLSTSKIKPINEQQETIPPRGKTECRRKVTHEVTGVPAVLGSCEWAFRRSRDVNPELNPIKITV